MSKTHYKSLIDSDWLGQWDLNDRKAVVVIESVSKFKPLQKRKKRDPRTGIKREEPNKRLDIGFRGKRKHWLAGPTSQDVIAKMYGTAIEGWIGKAICLYVDPEVRFGDEKTGGIRVEPRIPQTAPTTDPLDNPVDEDLRAQQNAAAGRDDEESIHDPVAP